jgi:hypothetical protein
LQRRKGFLGFPYAVVKKYVEDAAGREAALITYYGFLSVFPLLLVIVSVLSNVLVTRPGLRQELIEEVVPPLLQETVDDAVTAMPSSGLPFVIGLIGLLFAGTGVVLSAYRALNHLAGVPMRARYGSSSGTPGLGHGAGRAGRRAGNGRAGVGLGLLPDITGLQQFAAALGTAVVVFVMLTIAGSS